MFCTRICQRAGLLPTLDQIEQFHIMLPKASLSNLMVRRLVRGLCESSMHTNLLLRNTVHKRFIACFLQDTFSSMCVLDYEKYFLCEIGEFKHLADLIEHIPLPIVTRYVFCCAPVKATDEFMCEMFVAVSSKFRVF